MENFSIPKHTSVPSFSRANEDKFESVGHSSLTHPSVRSRSRDYLDRIFKKVNSGNNVLSRIPTRIDPNIEFSDDEDEDPPTPVNTKFGDDPFKTRTANEKENEKRIASSTKAPDISHNSGSMFNNILYTQEKKRHEALVKCHSNELSKISSAFNVNAGRVNCLENRKRIPVTKDSSNVLTKSDVNRILPPDVKNNLPEFLNKINKDNSKCNDKNKSIYTLPSDIIEVNNKVYNVLSLLGTGGSCKVYSVYDIQNKSRVAVKRVDLKDTDPLIREGYKQEIEYLQKLQNSNRVIKMYDFEYRENELLLVLEHGDIDFARYISNEAKLKRLTPLMIKFFWSQMLEAVADIHKYGIIHSDLKPANFLLVAGNLKLIDFGIATSVPEDKTSTFRDTQVGTLNYMSPEAITQMSNDSKHPRFKIGVKSDVWSLGCILYNLVYGVTPFYNIKTLAQKIYAITNPNHEIPFKPLPDPLLLDVLKSCLKRNPKERASVEELLKHPYLAEDTISVNTAPKANTDFDNVLKQMQFLTPRRIRSVTKFVEALSEKSDK